MEEESDHSVKLSSCCLENVPSLQGGRQFNFLCDIRSKHGDVKTSCLTDTGASGNGFIDEKFAKRNGLTLVKMKEKCTVRLADDEVAATIAHMAQVTFKIGDHHDEIWCFVTKLGKFSLILGMPWLELHDPQLSFKDRSMTFNSDYCMSNCLSHSKPVTIFSGKKPHQDKPKKPIQDIAEISAYAFTKLSAKSENMVTAMWPTQFEQLESNIMPGAAATTDVAAITAEDYEKFFSKLKRAPLSREKLKRLVPSKYHDYLGVWDPVEANKLPPHRPTDHPIDLIEGASPPYRRTFGLSREKALVVKVYIEDMLGKGYIRKSNSPYAAPVLVVQKPDGGLRVCVDYRALNALTIKNRNAPPLIRETLSRLCASRVYTKFDVIAAFNEIRIREGDEEKTAFLTRYGLFEYVVMPFGLCNAPGTFQSFINEVLREYLDDFCTAYLDDILIYSNDRVQHEAHVKLVLKSLQKAGIFLDINKCDFDVKEIKYLGLIITTEGVRMDPKKVEVIQQWKAPRCVKDVQSFLGFTNFYRRFIKGCSKIAVPLSSLTKGDHKDFVFPWPQDGLEQKAFTLLKDAFVNDIILAHFDPDKETWIESDASDYVVAAVLSQKDDQGVIRPVAFLSKKMSPAECNYDIYDKELLAIIRAFEEWHPELAGTPIEDPIRVITDHRNLEYFMTSKKLNRRQARWAEFLSEFNFKITYRPGKMGAKPDSLTRRQGDIPEDMEDVRNQFQNQTILKEYNLDHGMRKGAELATLLIDESFESLIQIAAMTYDIYEGDVEASGWESLEDPLSETPPSEETPSGESLEDPRGENPSTIDDVMVAIREAYEDDDIATRIRHAKSSGQRKIPPDIIKKHGVKIELGDCTIHDDLLYVHERIYVPKDKENLLRTRIIKDIHETPPGGHAGRNSSYVRIARHYYWPQMTETIATYIRSCHKCKRTKSYREGKQGLLKPLPIPERYWSDISVDFITPLPICLRHGRSYQHIMVVVDRLSKKKKFMPLDSLSVESVVQAFVEWVWREEGFPLSVISDRGTQFTSYFWKRLCERIGTSPKLSTSFHPETDGQTESANAALKQYLRAYVNYGQDDWVDFLAIAEFEANSDVNSSTGISPFMATKGYIPRSGIEPRTPWNINTASPTARTEMELADKYADKIGKLKIYLKEQLEWSRELQAEQANRNRTPAPEFRMGDMVMLDARNIKTDRPMNSLDSKNLGPFRIIRCINNMAYELDLPESMTGLFPVFHPWLLHLDKHTPLPGQVDPIEDPINVDEDQGRGDYVAQEVVDSRIDRRRRDPATGQKGCLVYRIKYTNDELWNSRPKWQSYEDTEGCKDLVADFHHLRPDKPGPHATFIWPPDWSPPPVRAM